MKELERREPLDTRMTFLTNDSQSHKVKQVSRELFCGYSEVIRGCIEIGLARYYEITEEDDE